MNFDKNSIIDEETCKPIVHDEEFYISEKTRYFEEALKFSITNKSLVSKLYKFLKSNMLPSVRCTCAEDVILGKIKEAKESMIEPSKEEIETYELAKSFICSPRGCNLSESFFNEYFSDFHIYSEGDEPFPVAGKVYGPPVGWIRFKLKVDPKRSQMVQQENWHYCYHGTHPSNLKSIVTNGFLIPGDRTVDGDKIRINPGHAPNQKFIFTSPSYIYSSHFIYATEIPFTYQNILYYGRLMFQVRQKSKTFKIQPITLSPDLWDNTVKIDPLFENETIEWKSHNKESIFPYAVLIKMNKIDAKTWFRQHLHDQISKSSIDLGAPRILRKIHANNIKSEEEKKKILWVDDNPLNNKTLIDYAQSMGVPVLQRISTSEGLKTIQGEYKNILMIITDMVRKEGVVENFNAGLDLITQVHNKYPKIPIYLYSSYARTHPSIIASANSAGCTKSVGHDELAKIIHLLKKEKSDMPPKISPKKPMAPAEKPIVKAEKPIDKAEKPIATRRTITTGIPKKRTLDEITRKTFESPKWKSRDILGPPSIAPKTFLDHHRPLSLSPYTFSSTL